MFDISQLMDMFGFLSPTVASYASLLLALLVVVLPEWRGALLALMIQYVVAGWLLSQELAPDVAVLKIAAGMVICLAIYLSARQADVMMTKNDDIRTRIGDSKPSISLTFRLIITAATATTVVVATTSGYLRLPEISGPTSLAAISAMAMGCLALGLHSDPLRAGMGLLTSLAGFDLFYHSLEQGVTVIGMMIGLGLLVAMVISYLSAAQYLPPPDHEENAS
ncbi:MAG: hypothetical protein ABFQ89_01635 [Chloroflexota bacterium]